MGKVDFYVGGSLMKAHDAAIVLADEDALAVLVDAAIQTISTDVEITCGGVTLHLAAWQDPDHWSDDWAGKGIDADDVAAFVAAQVSG